MIKIKYFDSVFGRPEGQRTAEKGAEGLRRSGKGPRQLREASRRCGPVHALLAAALDLVEGLSEGVRLAQASGVDTDKVLEAISGGAAQSWQMENRWCWGKWVCLRLLMYWKVNQIGLYTLSGPE